MAKTPLGGEIGERWRNGLTLRPAMLLGKDYPAVSAAYSATLHRIVAEKATPALVLRELQHKTALLAGLVEKPRH